MFTARNGRFSHGAFSPYPCTEILAKKLAREQGITRLEALDRLAKREGFQGWSHLVASGSLT